MSKVCKKINKKIRLLKYIELDGDFTAYLYCHRLKNTGTKFDGQEYLGITTNWLARMMLWFCKKASYGGRKIDKARKLFGVDNSHWDHEIIGYIKVNSSDKKTIRKILRDFEAKHIKLHDSYNNGFNSNLGGRGMFGIQHTQEAKNKISKKSKAYHQSHGNKVTAIFPDGHSKQYPTMFDAAKDLNINVGSVSYSYKHGTTTRNGYKFIAA